MQSEYRNDCLSDIIEHVSKWRPGACSKDACSNQAAAGGLCRSHLRERRQSDPSYGRRLKKNTDKCSVVDCFDPFYCKGFCIKHYNRWRQHGDVTVNLTEVRANTEPCIPETLALHDGRRASELAFYPEWRLGALRILANSTLTRSGCWEYNGAHDMRGYGRFTISQGAVGTRLTHRYVYQAVLGPIPEELLLDHLCRNPPCCNPLHLEPVTARVNTMRGLSLAAQNARKTECLRGHPFDDVNTYWTPKGFRQCRTCNHNRYLARRASAA